MRPVAIALGALLAACLAVAALATPAAADPHPAPPRPGNHAEDSLAGLYSSTSMDLVLLTRREGASAALDELERRLRRDPRLGGVCHAIAHDLGHEALARAHGVVATALSARNDVCGGGYTHGIIEVALGSSKHPEKDLLTVCAPSQDGSCFHGVGHGLMFATGMKVRKSIDLCDRSPSALLAARCGEGVFMQLFSADGGAHGAAAGGPAMTPVTAREQCRHTRTPYAANCWFYAPTVWLAARPDDFSGAMRWCDDAGSDQARQLCAKGVGSRTIKYHPDDSCLAGMGSYWSVHHKGRKAPSDVCRHLGDATLADRCRAATRA